mmetsp:Transcript_46875/g.102019  ORF Transcript_46875/g.102019 Transcript_46875/m.102019 type:complete len:258 (-) Transcript_46875:354-1127(-)
MCNGQGGQGCNHLDTPVDEDQQPHSVRLGLSVGLLGMALGGHRRRRNPSEHFGRPFLDGHRLGRLGGRGAAGQVCHHVDPSIGDVDLPWGCGTPHQVARRSRAPDARVRQGLGGRWQCDFVSASCNGFGGIGGSPRRFLRHHQLLGQAHQGPPRPFDADDLLPGLLSEFPDRQPHSHHCLCEDPSASRASPPAMAPRVWRSGGRGRQCGRRLESHRGRDHHHAVDPAQGQHLRSHPVALFAQLRGSLGALAGHLVAG